MPLNNPLSYLNALRMGPGSIPGVPPGTVPVHDVFSNIPEQAQNLTQRTKDTARNFGTTTMNKARAARDATAAAMRNGAANVAARASALGDVTLGQAARTLARSSLPTAGALALGSAMYDKAEEDYQQYLNNVQREGGVTHFKDEGGTWIPTNNPGEWRNIETDELMKYDMLANRDPNANAEFVPQVTLENGQFTLDSNPASTTETALPETVQESSEPETTVFTPQAKTSSVSGVSYPTGSSGPKKKKEDKAEVKNQISGFNALIPLLALGGLGYFMARR